MQHRPTEEEEETARKIWYSLDHDEREAAYQDWKQTMWSKEYDCQREWFVENSLDGDYSDEQIEYATHECLAYEWASMDYAERLKFCPED